MNITHCILQIKNNHDLNPYLHRVVLNSRQPKGECTETYTQPYIINTWSQ